MSQPSKTVYQYDLAGLYQGETQADESPLEPGVYLMPARTTEAAPPEEWPADRWPRWNGGEWQLVNRPRPPAPEPEPDDPALKLRRFLEVNPDVAEMVGVK
ncbi:MULTISPECIES: hypothetical protein [unclassified Halomonas]|uniref:hypothetical protein n=1 Tax=unclassified Halomonas TaxID=2609666 RepID=UPI00288645F5|nr:MULTISPECIES: hypothetical protein [unclassified Halomonas]MDT0499718.1 hypothetical protein [Halomonas sp. PAR7]MDT0510465.1 hypothetical protein [Halomonas sp. LES1]MDT0589826.1 hypothetical protein [Halomonas sp. PAR8]